MCVPAPSCWVEGLPPPDPEGTFGVMAMRHSKDEEELPRWISAGKVSGFISNMPCAACRCMLTNLHPVQGQVAVTMWKVDIRYASLTLMDYNLQHDDQGRLNETTEWAGYGHISWLTMWRVMHSCTTASQIVILFAVRCPQRWRVYNAAQILLQL